MEHVFEPQELPEPHGVPVAVPEPMALVCLGWVPWGRSWKRNQSMVYQLSRLPLFERTVFVNPQAMWVSNQFRLDQTSFSDRVRRVRDSLPREHDDRIHVCSQWHFMPFKGLFTAGARFEDWLFRRSILTHLRGRPFVLLNNHPNFFSGALLRELMDTAALRVFDLSDDFVEFFDDDAPRELFRRNIEFCCTNSDLVMAINRHVAEKYGCHNPNTVVVPNSTNFSNFDREEFRPIPWLESIRARGGPILGCTGIINRVRIDYDLLERVVSARPDWQFVFVGNADRSFLDIVARHPNLNHSDPVPYDELPDWIAYFNAAIIPFRINEHTRGNDLLKFHDYLAMGKSIVTTNTGGAWKFEGLIHIAEGEADFLEAIDQAILPVDPALRERRISCARENSWGVRALEIADLLRQQLEVAKHEDV